ncbi:MAG TPA: DUF2264 domain-containing protein [Roseiflexaceae bacterium]|nr:DUF2264 domain-containing protein [Roseiflexaceae bacterium]
MRDDPFTHDEALALWARLVAGWAAHLDASGARTLIDGVPNENDAGGSYEGVTRMLWGLGGWLSRPERPATLRWRGATFDLEELARRALTAGTDPRSPGSWWRGAGDSAYDQRTVESGQVSFVAWQTRERIWTRLGPEERANLVAWLERFGRRPDAWRSNWALFWALNHAGRKALGQPHDQATIDSALDYLEGVACGDGWYDDAPWRGPRFFDDYNLWVFATHVLAWAECDGATQPARRARLLERVRLGMERLPFFFAADGAYAEYGRSLSYKFARLGAPLWAYRLGCWPHSPGLLRRLVGRHMRWYVDRGALRADGTLRQELAAGGSPAVRETYISTGATYWAMLAFAGLWALPDDDQLWTAEEEPLPVERGDFVRVFPHPGWVLVGTQATGAVQRLNAGSTGHYPAKYDKFLYATAAPFNVGLADGAPGPDSMLCLAHGPNQAHRTGTDAFAVGEPGWLRMRYRQRVGGGTHTIDTTIVVRGELHLRAHRVTLDPAAGMVTAVEGPAPLGYPPGAAPDIRGDEAAGWEYAAVDGRAVAIVRLRGYDGQRPAAAWGGRPDLNSVYPEHVLPLLAVSRLQPQHELVCLAYTGRPLDDPGALAAQVSHVAWDADGTLRVTWAGGETVSVPARAGE